MVVVVMMVEKHEFRLAESNTAAGLLPTNESRLGRSCASWWPAGEVASLSRFTNKPRGNSVPTPISDQPTIAADIRHHPWKSIDPEAQGWVTVAARQGVCQPLGRLRIHGDEAHPAP